MGAWQFFNKAVAGKNYIRIEWFWRVHHDDGRSTEAQGGFGTLPACLCDAARRGYTSSDAAEYDLADLRWYA